MRVYDAKLRGGDLLVIRDGDDGKEVGYVDPPVEPYCYVPTDQFDEREATRRDASFAGTIDGHVRLEFDSQWALDDFADQTIWDTRESDVRADKRPFVDAGWSVARPDPDDILYFDIEVDASDGFPEPREASSRILSIAGVDGEGREMYFDDDDERELVESFLEAADGYPVLAGWNALGFDYEYLEHRSERLGMSPNWGRWVKHDMQPLYDMLAVPTKTVSLKLDDVARRELGAEKTEDVAEDREALLRWWEDDPERLREYNMQDADILRRLDDMYGVVELLHVVCDICGYPPGDACYIGKSGQPRLGVGNIADAMVLSVAHDRGVPMPDKGGDKGDFPGADVLDPNPGLYEGIATIDYSGMYPNIIRAFNFGPTTWYEDERSLRADHPDAEVIRAESGVFVGHDTRKSIPAEAADRLIELREGAPDIVDKGVKVVNNTLYGIFASAFHRYYVSGMSENITLLGQRLVRLAEDAAEDVAEVEEVVYGDTDSVMALLNADGDYVTAAERAAGGVQDALQRWAEDEMNARGSYLELDVDDVYDRFYISDKKKRYFGRAIDGDGPEFKVKGFEVRQGSYAEPVRNFQRELMGAIIEDGPVSGIIEGWQERVLSGDLDGDLASRKTLNREPEDYEADTPPLHARAAMAIREEHGEHAVEVGDKVSYIKYGPDVDDWTYLHDGETGRPLHRHHRAYIWDDKFRSVMRSIDVARHRQTELGGFA